MSVSMSVSGVMANALKAQSNLVAGALPRQDLVLQAPAPSSLLTKISQQRGRNAGIDYGTNAQHENVVWVVGGPSHQRFHSVCTQSGIYY